MNALADARSLIGAHRTARSWTDRYLATFAALLAVVMLAAPLLAIIGQLNFGREDPSAVLPVSCLLAMALAALAQAARAVGPVCLPPADASWLVLSPLPRRAVLAPRVLLTGAVVAVTGAVSGVGGLAAMGVPDALMFRLVAAAASG